jgi:hypothetical protein
MTGNSIATIYKKNYSRPQRGESRITIRSINPSSGYWPRRYEIICWKKYLHSYVHTEVFRLVKSWNWPIFQYMSIWRTNSGPSEEYFNPSHLRCPKDLPLTPFLKILPPPNNTSLGAKVPTHRPWRTKPYLNIAKSYPLILCLFPYPLSIIFHCMCIYIYPHVQWNI